MKQHQIWFYCYTILALVYSIFIVHDIISIALFMIILVHFVGLIPFGKFIIVANIFTLFLDTLTKVIYSNTSKNNSQTQLQFNPDNLKWSILIETMHNFQLLDFKIINHILDINFNSQEILYILLWFCLCAAVYNYFADRKYQPSILYQQVSYYLTPILLYALLLFQHFYFEQLLYLVGFLSLFLIGRQKGLLLARFAAFIGISKDFIWVNLVYLYQKNDPELDPSKLFDYKLLTNFDQIQISIKIVLICCLQTYSQKQGNIFQKRQKHPEVGIMRKMSLGRRVRYISESSQNLQTFSIKTIIVYILTLTMAVFTNCIGNIFIVLAVYLNLPNHKKSKFRFWVILGVIISLVTLPSPLSSSTSLANINISPLIYALYLLIIRDIHPPEIQHFPTFSYEIVVMISRLYILLNHVSVINFLIGLFANPTIVFIAISFKIISRHLNIVSIFIGTNENYGFQNMLSFSSLDDTFLWGYLILLLLFNRKSKKTFEACQILDIFRQYPIFKIKQIQYTLHILKFFHWLSYIFIGLIVLYSQPSLFCLLRALVLFIIIATDIRIKKNSFNRKHEVINKNNQMKNRTIRLIWSINLYLTSAIAFIKYFYLLKLYDLTKNQETVEQLISPWLKFILQNLSKNSYLLGLPSLDNVTITDMHVWKLLSLFLSDIAIIIISIIMGYIMEIKIYDDYRWIFIAQQKKLIQKEKNEDEDLQRLDSSRKSIKDLQKAMQKIKITKEISISQLQQALIGKKFPKYSLDYLYQKFVKPLHFSFDSQNLITKLISTYIIDAFFVFIVLIYLYEQPIQQKFLYLPHFLVYAFYFFAVSQTGQANTSKFIPRHTEIQRQVSQNVPNQKNGEKSEHPIRHYILLFYVIYTCLTIVYVYSLYLWSYIMNSGDNQETYKKYKLTQVLGKLLILIVALIIFQFENYYRHDPANNQLLHWIGINGFKNIFKSQILMFLTLLIKAIIAGMWIGLMYNGHFSTYVIHTIFIIAFIGRFIKKNQSRKNSSLSLSKKSQKQFKLQDQNCESEQKQQQQTKKINTSTIVMFGGLVIILDVWIGSIFCIFGILLCRVYFKLHFEKTRLNEQIYSEQVNQYIQNSFSTFLLIARVLISLLPFLAVTLLQPSSGKFLMGIVCWILILLILFGGLLEPERINIRGYVVQGLMLTIILFCSIYYFYIISLFYMDKFIFKTNLDDKTLLQLHNHPTKNGPGIMIMLASVIFLMNIISNKQFQQRIQTQHKYWNKKADMLAQLGSQLHNQKKIISLQKIFWKRQKLQFKVQRLLKQLNTRKQRHQENKIAEALSLESFFQKQVQDEREYQIYSNMLVVMDFAVISQCYKKLNLYHTQFTLKNDFELSEVARDFRKDIFHKFRESIEQAISQYRNQRQNFKSPTRQRGSSSIRQKIKTEKFQESKSKTIQRNIQSQKSQSENQSNDQIQSYQSFENISPSYTTVQVLKDQYEEAFKLIHKTSMDYPWLIRKTLQNLETISLVIITGWNLFGGVYTIPINIVIFAWAIVVESRTTIRFWFAIIIYTGFIAIFKIFLASPWHWIEFIRKSSIIQFIFFYNPSNCYYEFVIISLSVIQIVFIYLSGTAFQSFAERQSIFDAFYRNLLNRFIKGNCKSDTNNQYSFMSLYKQLKYTSDKKNFIYRVFSKTKFKPGKDFYPLIAIIQLAILLYIFFFYDLMQYQSRAKQRSIGELLVMDRFSSNMVVALFIHILIMIADRFIVSLNTVDESNKKLQNFFLAFTFGSQNVLQKHQAPKTDQIQRFNLLDFLLLLKYVFHVFLLFLINFLVYFYIPSAGLKKNLIPTCQQVSQNCSDNSYTFLSIFLFLQLLYFMASGLQIKHGFHRNKCRNTLMENYDWGSYYLYLGFTAIPFLWQFKKICDWTLTATALPLFHWMKFQDINARLYISKCEAQLLTVKRPGSVWYKYLFGPLGFLSIMCLVFSPLMVYSQINPFAVNDQVIGSSITLNLYDNNNIYKLFSTSHVGKINKVDESQGQSFGSQDNLYHVQMSKYPDENFIISQPALAKLADRVKQASKNYTRTTKDYKFVFSLKLMILEKLGGQTNLQWTRKQLSKKQLTDLYNFLTLQTKTIIIHNFFSPFPGRIQSSNVVLYAPNLGQYFELFLPVNKNYTFSQSGINKEDLKNIKPLYFYFATSTKFKIGIGVVTVYLTYVLLVSRLLRYYLTGGVQNIIYEGWQMERVLVLCQAVRSARVLEKFEKQEYFYFQLMDLMRSPKKLKNITGDFQDLRIDVCQKYKIKES